MGKRLAAIVALTLALPVLTACQSDNAAKDRATAIDTARDQQIRQFLAEQQRGAATQRAMQSSMPSR